MIVIKGKSPNTVREYYYDLRMFFKFVQSLKASSIIVETVFPACGSSNSAIEMTPADLEKYAQNYIGWVDVCKGWQDEE